MSRLKVLIVTGYFPLNPGGAEYQAYLLASQLKKVHDVSFLFRYGNQKRKVNREGVTLYQIPRRVWTRRLFGRDHIMDYLVITAVLETIRPDIIYNTGANAYTGIAARYASKNGCRMVWHIASDRDVDLRWSNSVRASIFDRVDTKCVEYGIRNADSIIGQTAYQDELLYHNYGRICDLIVGNWLPIPSEPLVKDEPFKVVWVANVKPLKQPNMFIHLARMLEGRHDVRFIMIGRPASGSYQKRLDKAIKRQPNVVYMGERSIDEVNGILAGAHVFVNTSLYEGFPNTFIQAWLRQVPVVSLNVDPDGLLKTEKLGFHSGSLEGLVRDTERLIDDSDLRMSMGKRAQEYALRHHSMGPNIAQTISLLVNTR